MTLRYVVALSGAFAAMSSAHALSDYAVGSMHARAVVSTGDANFDGASMQWDRTVLHQSLTASPLTVTIVASAPLNAINPRVSATGAAVVSNPTIALSPPNAFFRYGLNWSPGPLPREGTITAGFDTALTSAPQSDASAPQLYRTEFEGFNAIVMGMQSGLPRHGSFFDVLPGSTMTYEMEYEGNWVLGGNGPGGARRTIVSFDGSYTILEDFVYDESRNVTRLVIAQEYEYGLMFNAVRVRTTLIGQPVPTPAAGLLMLVAAVTSASRRHRAR